LKVKSRFQQSEEFAFNVFTAAKVSVKISRSTKVSITFQRSSSFPIEIQRSIKEEKEVSEIISVAEIVSKQIQVSRSAPETTIIVFLVVEKSSVETSIQIKRQERH
jgi:hypothetical protein